MDEISRNKSKWIAKLIALFSFGLLFSICVGISSADIEFPNIEEGDSICATIDMDSTGLVDVTAWTNGGNNDDIKLYLYNQTSLIASASGSWDQVSVDDFPLSTGMYTVKAYLTDASGGGTRIISVTSNRQLSELPKYRKSNFGVVDGKAKYFNLNVDEEGWIFLNAWTNGSNNDDIKLYLYNQTDLIASASGSWDQVSITYLAPSVGMYTIKAYLTDASGGGTRTVSVTSNYPLLETSSSAKYIVVDTNKTSKTAPSINIEDIQLIDMSVGSYYIRGTVSDTDGIKFIKINGNLIAGSDQFNAVVTNIYYGDIISIEAGDISGNITQQKIQINNEEDSPWIKLCNKIILPIFVILAAASIGALITRIYNSLKRKKFLNNKPQ